jgi:hypothetical protein
MWAIKWIDEIGMFISSCKSWEPISMESSKWLKAFMAWKI